MILHKLIVKTKDGKVIREIQFKEKGISFIVDEENKLQSGNNIGKTTLVKIIDICLGHTPASTLYLSPDTGENHEIKDYISKEKVTAELIINNNGKLINYTKGLYPRAPMYIDGKKIKNNTMYRLLVKEQLFGYKEKKPTLNQLRRKFIRIDQVSESAVRKFLKMGSNIEYQAIYEILFNFGSIKGQNLKIKTTIDKKEKKIKSFLELNNVDDKEDLILKRDLINDEVLILEKEITDCSTVESFLEKEKEFTKLNLELSNLSKKLDEMQFKKKLYSENLEYEKNQISQIDTRALEILYSHTKLNINKELKTLEEVKNFHNSMTKSRISILGKKIESIDESIDGFNTKISSNRKVLEKTYLNFNMNLNEQFQKLTLKLNELKGKENEVSRSLNKINQLNDEISLLEKKLVSVIKEDDIEEKLSQFNDILSSYSKKVLNQIVKVNYKKESDSFPITLIGIDGNLGTGESKALIACYDLALIKYYMDNGLNRPYFLIHDKMENIDLTYLGKIKEIMDDFEGQYIIPILRDRVTELNISKDSIICELSRTSKFFKV